jgi:hypothetical protein
MRACHSGLDSTASTRAARAAQYRVELPAPYSNTRQADMSSVFRNSIAG